MDEKVIWYIAVFGAAALFYMIGVYAQRREKPMWFWAGTEVSPSEITDVKEYNRACGRMWKRYSGWFWLAGVAEIWNSIVALAILALACTAGLAALFHTFREIERKYRVR